MIHQKPTQKKLGFTIVELLVVIVVIGILAAITVIGYIGIQNSARSSAAKNSVSQAAKRIASSMVLNSDAVPTSLSNAGVSENGGTLYEYTYDAGVTPNTFCVTATVGGVSYYQNNTTASVPTSGKCPGHTGGVVPSLAFTEQTTSGSRDWYRVAISSDASRIYGLVRSSSTMYVSSNFGSTWASSSSPSSSATSIASSADGTKLVGGTYTLSGSITITNSGNVLTSTNSGGSWTVRSAVGARPWAAFASSADGVKLFAASVGPIVDDYETEGNLWTSTDSGVNWTQRSSAGVQYWSNVASSADGTRLVGATRYGYVSTSADSGATWTQRTSIGSSNWSSITISNDGQKILANGFYGNTRVSQDGGATWTTVANATSYGAASRDGSVMVRGGQASSSTPTALYVSTDSGVTWTANTSAGTRRWSGFAVSDDGTKFVGITTNGYIYTGTYQ